MKISQITKKAICVLLIWCMMLCCFPAAAFAANEEYGFTYELYNEAAGTIKITGYNGTLEAGEDLIVPSQIDGKTVVAISGTYGTWGISQRYGDFILPNTIKSINNFWLYSFGGTLEIPESVTSISGFGFDCLTELIVNANVETFTVELFERFDLEQIVIGGNVKYFITPFFCDNGSSPMCPRLKTVIVSDNVRYISIDKPYNFAETDILFPQTTFYLKRQEAPYVKLNSFDQYEETGERTMERALAVNLANCQYVYTNENEDLPVEKLCIQKKEGFFNFSSKNGLYKDWSAQLSVTELPLNCTDDSAVEWLSSDPNIATVENGVVTAKDLGNVTITARKGQKEATFDILIRGIQVVSADDGVNADNLPGNMEIPDADLNGQAGISLELEVDKLNPKDWTQWGQLKKALEEALNKSLECSDAFDIQVKLKNGTYTWKVQPIEGKRISIWMPIENAQDISKRHLIHLKDDGTYEELDFEYEPIDGVHGIRFETTSFSSFILLKDACSDSHTWDNDCDQDCNVCGETRTTEHNWKNPTCSEKAVCTVCGASYGELDYTNHAGGTEVKDAKAATCGADGYTGDTYCNGCGEIVKKGTTLKASGEHTGGTATCSEKVVCTACGTSYGELDSTNHTGGTEVKDAKAATCGADGYTGDTYCNGCGEIVKKGTTLKASGEHTYGEWTVVKKATTTAKGEKQRTCSVCGHVDSEEIPVLSDIPATGDNSNIMLYGSMFTLSLAVLVVLFLSSKKRKQTY